MATKQCLIPECELAAHARGWCNKHYYRWYRTGDARLVLDGREGTAAAARRRHQCSEQCEIPFDLWARYADQAKIRGIFFQLKIQDAWEIFEAQDRRCALSGVELTFARKSGSTASLDRLVVGRSSPGYVLGNVQWVHKTVNIMRNVLSVDDFVAWCVLIAQRQEL